MLRSFRRTIHIGPVFDGFKLNSSKALRDPATKSSRALTAQQRSDYHRDGYVLVRGMFSAEEMKLVMSAAKDDTVIAKQATGRNDAQGGVSKLSLMNHPGNNIYGAIARCARVVDSVETLLEGEAYHYHSKVMIKEPFTGGAWEWHQDYGYWYENGCLAPLMLSVMVVLDRHTKLNGCLQVLRQSHNMGRVDHALTGEQAGADAERVKYAMQLCELVAVEAEPGDAFFMHCNTLHASEQNKSPNPRWSLICCYNAARNNPFREHHHPMYTPLDRWSDASLVQMGARGIASGDGTVFFDVKTDQSASGLSRKDKDKEKENAAKSKTGK